MNIALSRQALDEVDDEMDAIVEICERDPRFLEFLMRPQVLATEKREFLKKVFGEKISKESLNMLMLLVDKNRAAWIREIAARFSYFADRMRGVDRGVIVSAVELSDTQKANLQAVLQRHSQHEIKLEFEIDPSLIAGIVVKIGDHVVDGSAAHRLEMFRRRLLAARVTVATETEAGA